MPSGRYVSAFQHIRNEEIGRQHTPSDLVKINEATFRGGWGGGGGVAGVAGGGRVGGGGGRVYILKISS